MKQVACSVYMGLPAVPLRACISGYWLSRNNTDRTCTITPDGVVDVVTEVGAANSSVRVHGTVTRRLVLPLDVGSHYIGIRFKPGQARHFMDVPARELADAVHSAEQACFPRLPRMAEAMASGTPFTYLDAVLLEHLRRRPPRHAEVDAVIEHVQATAGRLSVSELSTMHGRSRRQLERDFLDSVGLPAKLFSRIIRFRHASALLADAQRPLADIAADLGYADQSHFTRDFSRFFGLPPSRARMHVAFLQDSDALAQHNQPP